MDKLGLVTWPDFEGAYIDAPVFFMDKRRMKPRETPKAKGAATGDGDASQAVDPSHRLGRLKAANRRPVSVKPTDSVQAAITLMLSHDYSQLPIMANERSVKGMVSWKSIGSRVTLGQTYKTVQDCMEPAYDLGDDASMFDAIGVIAKHDCVLVRNRENRITGLVTAADISEQFHLRAEPFLLLGDIESRVRAIITPRFTTAELQSIRDPTESKRPVKDVSDLSFGEYQRLLEKEERWSKLGLNIDRGEFIKQLDVVRQIRNDVMHFDPDGIDEDALMHLRQSSRFLDRLQTLTC